MALDLGIFLEGSQSTFKVKVSENDAQAQFLLDKLTSSDGSVTITELNNGGVEQINLTASGGGNKVIQLAASDETSDLTTGTAKITFRMPNDLTLTEVRASVGTAPTGANLIVDINANGTSIFTTDLLSIDAGEKTSVTAATPPNITTTSLSDDDEIIIDIDQIGSTVAGTGLKITLIGS
jgi:hypothetical protein